MAYLLFSPEDATSMFSKKELQILIHLTTEQVFTLFYYMLNELWSKENGFSG